MFGSDKICNKFKSESNKILEKNEGFKNKVAANSFGNHSDWCNSVRSISGQTIAKNIAYSGSTDISRNNAGRTLPFFIYLLERRERQKGDKPVLKIGDNVETRLVPEWKARYYYLNVQNCGDLAAENCQLKVTSNAKKDDILNVRDSDNGFAIYPHNFWKLDDLLVIWNNQSTFVNPPSLNGGGSKIQIEFLRYVDKKEAAREKFGTPEFERYTIPAHFIVPYHSGYQSHHVAINAKDYDGHIEITSSKGKSVSRDLQIRYNKEKQEVNISII